MTQETFERAKMLYETANADQKYVLESLFPELAESEDEKIRKALISILKSDFEKDTTIFGISVEQIIAWLEKQKAIDVLDAEEREFADNVNSYCKDMDEVYKKGYDAGREAEKQYWLGKQDEQKDSVADFKAKDWYVSKVDGKIHNIYHSVDKVEPKFKVGDWITNGDYTWKIVEVKPLDYILQSQDGNIVDDTISHVDEQFHSFTIKDARDGDVLALSYASQNYILIYKGLHEKNFGTMMSVFCSYYVEKDTYDDETDSFHMLNTGEIITPATKKQRDILIKAMNDAGYTFDFEKKEMEWKPSEEQMKALKDACDEHWEQDGLDPLYTLYQDLMREKNYE